MGKITEIKYKILYKAFGDDEEKHATFHKYYPPFSNFLFTVGSFIGMLWVFNRILERIGFHKTVIILMLSVTVYMRAWMKSIKLQNETH